MIRGLYIIFFVVFISSLSFADTITGTVYGHSKGLKGVVVSDGYTCTQTDKNGHYILNVNDSAKYIFVVTPSGYIAETENGHPIFYKSIKGNNFDFHLKCWKKSNKSYRLLAIGDPQTKGDKAFKRFENEALPDIKKSCVDKRPTFALFLGDLVWDNLNEYDRVKSLYAQIGVPYYTVIGNHDHNAEIADDKLSASIYQQHFGPTNYAFNVGKDYFIVLDNIIYAGNKKYTCGFSARTLNWLKNYLYYVPKGAHLFIAMHAPAHYYQKYYKLKRVDDFLNLLNDFRVDILSGHMHVQSNYHIRTNVREYNVASIGGAWWLWDCTLCRDGTPYGYQIFQSFGNRILNFYHSIGHLNTFQFKILPVSSVKGMEDKLCIKIWNWDERWKVEWYEDGMYKGQMRQFSSIDPEYSLYLNEKYAQGKNKVDKFRQPANNVYFFFWANPDKNTKKVTIKVTDPYKEKYEQIIIMQSNTDTK